AALGNNWTNVGIFGGAASNTIGGTVAGAGNVISASAADGVEIHDVGSSANLIAGNLIGTDKTGTVKLGNTYDGIAVWNGAANNTIGGLSTLARNVISGSGGVGVNLVGSGTTGNLVIGNYLGVDQSGTVAMPNVHGVVIQAGASSN